MRYGSQEYWQNEVERLEKEMHEAPLAPIYTTHEGHRFIGNHTSAWARKSFEWSEAKKRLTTVEKDVKHTSKGSEE